MQEHLWDTCCIQAPGLESETHRPTGATIEEDQEYVPKIKKESGLRGRAGKRRKIFQRWPPALLLFPPQLTPCGHDPNCPSPTQAHL